MLLQCSPTLFSGVCDFSPAELFQHIYRFSVYEFDSSFTFSLHFLGEKYKEMKCKQLGPEDFEEAIKQILRETEESDLDKLIRNYIQGRSPLNFPEAMDFVHFVSKQKYCMIHFHQWRSRTTLYWNLSTISTVKLIPSENRSLRLVFSLFRSLSLCWREKET